MLKTNHRYSNNQNESPIKLYHRESQQKQSTQEILRSNLSTLLKKIAEMEIREVKYIEKIKSLQLNNMVLMRQNKEQIELMNKHPSEQIESLIRFLQAQIKRLNNLVNEESTEAFLNNKINKAIQEVCDQKKKCMQQIQILMTQLDASKQRLESLNLENTKLKIRERQLQDELYNLQARYDKKTIELKTTIIAIQEQKKKLIYENEIIKQHKTRIEKDFQHLRQQITLKFQILQTEISEYQMQKLDHLEEIAGLRRQLKITEPRNYFSFSKHELIDRETQTTMNFNGLIEQNEQLRYYIAMLQYQLKSNSSQTETKIGRFKSLE